MKKTHITESVQRDKKIVYMFEKFPIIYNARYNLPRI